MSYRPTSAGHTARDAPRGVEQENIGELVERARAFLNKDSVKYETARKEAAGVETSANVASALTLHPKLQTHRGYEYLGVFISALWNEHCQEKIICYPHDTPEIKFLGESLVEDKVLIIRGRTSKWTGENARGLIIITGTVGTYTGSQSQGSIIINGSCGLAAGNRATGPLITLTPIEISESFGGTHITPERYRKNRPLKEYVERLLELARDDQDAIAVQFGDGAAIIRDLETLALSPWQLLRRRS